MFTLFFFNKVFFNRCSVWNVKHVKGLYENLKETKNVKKKKKETKKSDRKNTMEKV